MKLVVMIPAYNEEANIEKAILSIPRRIVGVDEVKILVVNDGSQDKTVEMAMNGCADKIVSHKKNSGVGSAFMTGVRNSILMNADIMVTVDADSQFDSNQIPELIAPIMNNQADVVIGSRFQNGAPNKIPKIKYIANKFSERKFTVSAYDPYYKDELEEKYLIENHLGRLDFEIKSNLDYKLIKKYDCICIVQHHTKTKHLLEEIYKKSLVPLVYDCQNKISYDPKSKTILKGLGFTSNKMKYLMSSINT